MNVKIGVCLQDFTVNNFTMLNRCGYEYLKEYVITKLKYIFNNVDRLIVMGVGHVRVPPVLPSSYSTNDFNKLLTDQDLINLTKDTIYLPLTFSSHAPYWINANTRRQSIISKRYLTNWYDLMKVCGFNKYMIVCHVVDTGIDNKTSKFLRMINTLPCRVRKCLVIENDELYHGVNDCIRINKDYGYPIVYDNLHHRINNKDSGTLKEYCEQICNSWLDSDLPIKVHYSNGTLTGIHCDWVNIPDLIDILKEFKKYTRDIIVIFEVKHSQSEINSLLINLEPTQVPNVFRM